MKNETENGISNELFEKFAKLFFQKTGILLKSHKKYLVISRLQKFIGEGKKFKSFEEYYDALAKGADSELISSFVNVLTTNFSFFFRERIHFDFLAHYLKNKIHGNKELRIWSGACSTGDEPYSIAMTFLENVINPLDFDFKILATDISTKVLEIAQSGVYELSKVNKSLSKIQINNYFDHDLDHGTITANQKLKNLISFRKLNLMGIYPFRKSFDIVFLRNVLIYFNKQEKEIILNKIYDYIKPDGYLIIGLSESLVGIQTHFKAIKYSIYKK